MKNFILSTALFLPLFTFASPTVIVNFTQEQMPFEVSFTPTFSSTSQASVAQCKHKDKDTRFCDRYIINEASDQQLYIRFRSNIDGKLKNLNYLLAPGKTYAFYHDREGAGTDLRVLQQSQ